MRTAAALLVALCLALAVPHAATGVAGRWIAEVPTPFGPVDYRFTFRADAGSVTGTAESDFGRTTIEDGRIDGTHVTFVEAVSFDGRAIRFLYDGQLAGDEIRFTRRVGTEPAQAFTAVREGTRIGARPVPVPGRRDVPTRSAWPTWSRA